MPRFPDPIIIERRWFFDGHDVENLKRTLCGLEPLARGPRDPVKLLECATVMEELKISRSTLSRRVGANKTAA